MSSSSGLTPVLLGALQASLSVLLTIAYGVVAAQFNLLSASSARQFSHACVNMLLPALLLTNLGSEINLGTATRYVPVLVWAVAYNALSIGLGLLLERVLGLPNWAAPAIAFNNTTSMPLLLVQALEKTGILSSILAGPDDSLSSAVSRARAYFLVNTMVANTVTFGLGPKLLNSAAEDAPEEKKTGEEGDEGDEDEGQDINEDSADDERTSLLPSPIVHHAHRLARKTHHRARSLPKPVRFVLRILRPFANFPILGALLGAVIGLTPALKRAFFATPTDGGGGIFTAWLTSSLENLGDLFATLQVLVVGVKLAEAMRDMKEEKGGNGGADPRSSSSYNGDAADSASGDSQGGEEDEDKGADAVPLRAALVVSLVRFALWPAVGVAAIWALAKHTPVLDRSDPILLFTMMLMPAGPTALKLAALAEVNGRGRREKMGIAKFLAFSYTISPLIAFSVVASLRATEDVVGRK